MIRPYREQYHLTGFFVCFYFKRCYGVCQIKLNVQARYYEASRHRQWSCGKEIAAAEDVPAGDCVGEKCGLTFSSKNIIIILDFPVFCKTKTVFFRQNARPGRKQSFRSGEREVENNTSAKHMKTRAACKRRYHLWALQIATKRKN